MHCSNRSEVCAALYDPRATRAALALSVALTLFPALSALAQEQYQLERDLTAKHRLYREIGAGFRQIHRGPNGSYYILTAPAPAVLIYDSSGKQASQVP